VDCEVGIFMTPRLGKVLWAKSNVSPWNFFVWVKWFCLWFFCWNSSVRMSHCKSFWSQHNGFHEGNIPIGENWHRLSWHPCAIIQGWIEFFVNSTEAGYLVGGLAVLDKDDQVAYLELCPLFLCSHTAWKTHLSGIFVVINGYNFTSIASPKIGEGGIVLQMSA